LLRVGRVLVRETLTRTLPPCEKVPNDKKLSVSLSPFDAIPPDDPYPEDETFPEDG
jgi:hypothetical protein